MIYKNYNDGEFHENFRVKINKAGYTATPVTCGWAGAAFEVT